jgi:molecular chaperone GrpE (heat shock protein)
MFLTSISGDDKSFVLFSYLSQDFCISKKSCIFAIVKNKTHNKVNNKTEEVDITPENITPEDITPKQLDEPNYKDLYIWSLADYENMKKFMENRNSNAKRESVCDIVSGVIAPIYNDLRRGVKNKVNGCELILNNLKSSLEKFKVVVYDNDELVNEMFDVDRMEAIQSLPSSKDSDGLVFEVIDPCFVDAETGKTIVYAKVIVCNGRI